MTALCEFLRDRWAEGGFTTEDAMVSFLPLMRQVIEGHAAGKVSPLAGLDALRVEDSRIWFEIGRLQEPASNLARINELLGEFRRGAAEVIRRQRREFEVGSDEEKVTDLTIASPDDPVTQPVYLTGYTSWEEALGHHDPLTDVFLLGMILASLSCGLDFNDRGHLEEFVEHRGNLFKIKQDLHPVLARTIHLMTALDRHDRPADLESVLRSLENFSEQTVDFQYELAQIDGFYSKDLRSKQQIVLSKLQERLFEISRRNRLLHFRATMQTVNLTEASVPLSFDYKNIRGSQLLTWNEEFAKRAASGDSIALDRYLNFQEVIYLPSVLDRIRTEARRDQAEYGFAQLRLVACFLRWSDLKSEPPESYHSPLVLLPVELTRRKGVRDTYHLRVQSAEAEVNPVLRHLFKQLYEIDLPETIDLENTDLVTFHRYLTAQIHASQPAVQLQLVDRPRIELLHDKARRRLNQYQRRARLSGRGVRSYLDLDYSYDPANYHPLGLKLYSTLVRPPETSLKAILQRQARPRAYMVAADADADAEPDSRPPSVTAKERTLYALRQKADDNPYHWEFDLCSVTLGNFRYRKMSLVRDYAAMVDKPIDNEAYDSIFSLAPRPADLALIEPPELPERFHVVPCDPTQAAAIARGATGSSYIVQGPPGTGKSQTITNLIADYVGRGKRVLFVCEKRAAIDVVFLRLKQQSLDELCCLIHDSQQDKKQFVLDLKQTYERFLQRREEPTEERREQLTRRLKDEIQPLESFRRAMLKTEAEGSPPLREVLNRAIRLADERVPLDPFQTERLPDYAQLDAFRSQLERLAGILQELQPDGVLSRHPLSCLANHIAEEERPLEVIHSALAAARERLDHLEDSMHAAGIDSGYWRDYYSATRLVEHARKLQRLARRGQLSLLNPTGEAARHFDDQREALSKCEDDWLEKQQYTKNWRQKLPPSETEAALRQARRFEQQWWRFVLPGWWSLRSVLNRCYDFSGHLIRPTWVEVLEQLDAEHAAERAVQDVRRKLEREFDVRDDAEDFFAEATAARRAAADCPPELQPLQDYWIAEANGDAQVLQVVEIGETLQELHVQLGRFLERFEDLPWENLRENLDAVEDGTEQLPGFLFYLSELAHLPEELATALRTLPLNVTQLEAAAAERALDQVFTKNRRAGRFNGKQRNRRAGQLESTYSQWLQANAQLVRQRVRERFAERVRVASLPAAKLEPEQKEFKKIYNRGRRELEREFAKSMRFRSIRDLVSGESGEVVKDLKPVWLMSPLSVSDTLPLDDDHFDVVIFDEASQITLEEAVPTIFRAPQAIVVGDEMQLPPTDFFSSRREEEEIFLVEEGEEVVEYDLESNSLLNHAARNLSSTMLGWHYRSRSESLISFSNWAFYQGGLLTVPEEELPAQGRDELRVDAPPRGEEFAAEVMQRPVSFHFLENGVYENRRNRREADYIAHLVRGLMAQQPRYSMGIVAFSEAQQGEIESALSRLAREDRDFAEQLEQEWEREDEGEFAGLLVKNLENIQGDERDLIIMSVCYGPDPEGKVRMNFGPINKQGGEKRLNVAFSRAKHRMVLVSSMHSAQITNDYNDGANCLKRYLLYAQSLSAGRVEQAQRLLEEMAPLKAERFGTQEIDTDDVTRAIAEALRDRDYLVDLNVGQSQFRCDIAVRKPADEIYRLGVLVDTLNYYACSDPLEREMMRPKLLRDFGWDIEVVLAKDWREDSDRILEHLLGRLEQPTEPTEPTEADDEQPPPQSSGLSP